MAISLNAFTLRLKPARERDWRVFGQGGNFDVFGLLDTYLRFRKGKFLDLSVHSTEKNRINRTLEIKWHKKDAHGGLLSGIAEAGEHGKASPIKDIHTGQDVYAKRVSDADTPPYYFCIYVPNGGSRVILLLQKNGLHALNPSLSLDLKKYLAESHNLTCKYCGLTDPRVFKAYLKGGIVNEVRVFAHKLDNDARILMNDSKIGDHGMRPGTKVEFIIKEKGGFKKSFNDKLDSALTDGKSVSKVIEIPGLDDYDDATVKVDMDGHEKTFRVSKMANTGFGLDVTDHVKIDAETGQPTYASMHQNAKDILADIKKFSLN